MNCSFIDTGIPSTGKIINWDMNDTTNPIAMFNPDSYN
ncbi:unnamed protein product, partial [marine sediment metagenome]